MNSTLYRNTETLCLLMAAAIAVTHCWIWVDPSSYSLLMDPSEVLDWVNDPLSLPPWQWAIGFAVSAADDMCIIILLTTLRQMIRHMRCDGYFTFATVRLLKRIAKTMAFYVFAAIFISGTGMSLVMTITNTPGERYLNITLTSSHMLAVVMAMVAYIFARAFEEAFAANEELKQIV